MSQRLTTLNDQRKASPTKRGLLFVGHGTRDLRGTNEFLALIGQVKETLHDHLVEPCFLELTQPDIPTAWQTFVAQGVTHVRLIPVLLWAAGHALRDLPRIAGGLSQSTKIEFDMAPVLGFHPDVLARSHALYEARISMIDSWDPRRGALVLVGRGSTDQQATADMIRFGELRALQADAAVVEVGFVAMVRPSLGQILDQLGNDPSLRDIVVQPHLLFNGELNCTICKLVKRASWRYPAKRWWITDLLGPHPRIVQALVSRASETTSVESSDA